MTDRPEAYPGRHWVLAARRTGLRPVVDWGLRQPTPFRAMLPPFVGAVLNATFAYLLVRASATGLLEPVLGVGLALSVFWPLALALALGTDLLKKEHRFQAARRRQDAERSVT